MQLTESQSQMLTELAENIDNPEYDGHDFLKKIIELQEQGVDVRTALKENHNILLTEDGEDE